MNRTYRALSQATSFDEIREANRRLTGGRFTVTPTARELEIERQMIVRHSDGWWRNAYVKDFATSFVIFFTGAMIFLM
jgi:hypothetical protein